MMLTMKYLSFQLTFIQCSVSCGITFFFQHFSLFERKFSNHLELRYFFKKWQLTLLIIWCRKSTVTRFDTCSLPNQVWILLVFWRILKWNPARGLKIFVVLLPKNWNWSQPMDLACFLKLLIKVCKSLALMYSIIDWIFTN